MSRLADRRIELRNAVPRGRVSVCPDREVCTALRYEDFASRLTGTLKRLAATRSLRSGARCRSQYNGMPMIVGYHIIFGMYGFWLPNDPRGSWSDFVGSWELNRFGPATKTTETRSVASRSHDHAQRLAAKAALVRPAVELNGLQARAVGRGFATYAQKSGLPVWACAILPDHVHLVVGQSGMKIEQLAIQLKGSATEQLIKEELHPFQNERDKQDCPHKCFARGEWKVYLDPEDVPRAI